MTRVLMVLTGADKLIMADGREHPTGYWAEEVAASHQVLTEAGAEVDIATPGGVRPPVDPGSAVAPFTGYLDKIEDLLAKPLVLGDVSIDGYDAIYLPGGHGPMTDLAFDTGLGRLLREANDRGKIVAALCHGPAGLTVFTDNEELNGGTGEQTPYFVETWLRELGAIVQAGPAWSSTVVVDGTLITGQNPQSSVATATKVAEALR
jgi:putative intracellular protease/amidase